LKLNQTEQTRAIQSVLEVWAKDEAIGT
jgi:hypothetical protein